MNRLKKIVLMVLLLFFTSCGNESQINPNLGFDMWDYMTSARSYEVEYVVYENGLQTDYYKETHKQFGTEYQRESSSGLTTLFLNSNTILMREPNNSINIIRFLHLGDTGVFQSPTIQLCGLERFYQTYQNRGYTFYNVLQVTCTSTSGAYQEFYYGYNEGIVATYEKNADFITEYIKVSERAIF